MRVNLLFFCVQKWRQAGNCDTIHQSWGSTGGNQSKFLLMMAAIHVSGIDRSDKYAPILTATIQAVVQSRAQASYCVILRLWRQNFENLTMMHNGDILDFLSLPAPEPINDLDLWLKAPVPTSEPIGLDEDEKKKRNTQASARFRQKKKERDEQLKQERDNMERELIQLKTKISEQEKEIQWLKELIMSRSVDKEFVASVVKETLSQSK